MLRNNLKAFFLSVVVLCLLVGCSKTEKIAGPTDSGRGVALLKINKIAGSMFQKLADSAVITVSASDMLTIKQNLTVTDTSVKGKIEGIPAGKTRLFTLAVYDSLDTLQYRGSATADIVADSVAHITITIVRVSGAAVINTIINESDSIPTNGLVAYYPFNGNAKDESGNGNDGVVNGATLCKDRFGNSNSAFDFDGHSSWIYCGIPNKLNVYEHSITAWLLVDTIPCPPSYIIGKSSSSDYEPVLCFGIDSKGIFGSSFAMEGETYHRAASKNAVSVKQWQFVAMTYDGTKIVLSLNGKTDTIISRSGIPRTTTSAMAIGRHGGDIDLNGAAEAFFSGFLDDIRIYNRALSESEIQHLYHEGGWTGN
jgi:hypothetical protein